MNHGPRWRLGVGVLLGALVASCAGPKSSSVPPAYRLDSSSVAGLKKYPALFRNPPQQALGVSFVRQGYKTTNHTPAHNRALRLLAWSQQVRVQGEQLAEQTVDGLALRGDNIKLLEVPEIASEACRVETLIVEGRSWIVARLVQAQEEEHSWGEWGYFKPDSPTWINALPKDDGWLYATGMVKAPLKDEAGSWELATYRALVNLAENVALRVRHGDRVVDQQVRSAAVHVVDTRLSSFRVAARWRDAKHLYVLARVPRSGAVSLHEHP